jgi:hypothetical protein
MSFDLLGLTPGKQPVRQPWSLEELIRDRIINLSMAYEPGTHAGYASATRSYLAFCEAHNFSIKPTADTLSFYVFYPDVRQIRTSLLVRTTLIGAHKRFATPTTRKSPLLDEHLHRLHPQLDASYEDRLFWAIIVVGRTNLHRLGELVWPDQLALQSMAKVIKRLSYRHVMEGIWHYKLPYNKSDRLHEGNSCYLERSGGPLCPIAARQDYLALRDAQFPGKVALFLDSSGCVPKRAWFIRRLRQYFDASISGHSLRAGGATQLALNGVPDHLIQRIGRWTSDAFQIYIRAHPILFQMTLRQVANAVTQNN